MANIATLIVDQNVMGVRALGASVTLPNGFEHFDPMRETFEPFVAVANGPASRYRDEEVRPFLLEELGARMFRAGRLSHSAMVDHQRAMIARDAEYRKPAGSIDQTHDAERRQPYRGLPEAAAMVAVSAAGLDDLAALTVDGNLTNLPQPAFDVASKRFLELNIVEKYGMRAEFARKPTLSDPLPLGSDMDAARAQAQAVIDAHRADADVVAIHRRGLVDYARFLGHVFGMSAEDAFARIIGD